MKKRVLAHGVFKEEESRTSLAGWKHKRSNLHNRGPSCLFFDDGELREDFLHVTVPGPLVFAKRWVVQVHLFQGQQVLPAVLLDLLSKKHIDWKGKQTALISAHRGPKT